MGMYTELVLGVALIKQTPDVVISILKHMEGSNEDSAPRNLPNHPFFSTYRWEYLFTCDSYYFDGTTNTTFIKDRYNDQYYLTVRSNLKNYNSEIELFLDWIKPYLDTDGFLGYMRYEEDDGPTLIYHDPYEDTIKLVRYGVEEGRTIILDDAYLNAYCIR